MVYVWPQSPFVVWILHVVVWVAPCFDNKLNSHPFLCLWWPCTSVFAKKTINPLLAVVSDCLQSCSHHLPTQSYSLSLCIGVCVPTRVFFFFQFCQVGGQIRRKKNTGGDRVRTSCAVVPAEAVSSVSSTAKEFPMSRIWRSMRERLFW